MRLFLSTLFVVAILLFPQGRVHAENVSHGITISPAFQEITLGEKDAKTDFFVSITNTTESLITLRISVFDFGSLDESGGVAFLGASNDLEKKYALASWIRPEKDVFMLGPNETKKILVTIENRDALAPGGHYGALTFKTENDSDGSTVGDAIAVNQLFTTLLFVKKIGGEIYHLELKGSEYENSSIRFQDMLRLRFQNSGNIHVVPRGVVTVSDPIGRVVAKGIINEESSIILPETFRIYPVRLKPILFSFMPGRYTMEIGYRYDGKEDFATTNFQFFFVPLPAIGAGILLVVLAGRYGVKYRKKGSKKPNNSEKE